MRMMLVLFTVLAGPACGEGKKSKGRDREPTPAERMCELVSEAVDGSETATPCDRSMLEDCAAVTGMLSDPLLDSSADCVEAGGEPLECLVASTDALEATDAHRAFAAQFCSECLFGLPGCEETFFSESDPEDDAGLASALILPLGDSLVEAITEECASGLQCAAFPSCVQAVMAEQAVPEATITCIVDSFTGGLY